MDNVNQFFYEKMYTYDKGTETEHTAQHPTDNAMKSNFEKLCNWLDEQTTVYGEWASCKNVFICRRYLNAYCLKWMKNQLEQHYQIFFCFLWTRSFEEPGSLKIVAGTINQGNGTKIRVNFSVEKVRIITAAANLIKNKERYIRYETNVYPSKGDSELSAEFLSPTLKLLMAVLVGQGLKQESMGQWILKAMKSKSVILPLLFGLSVEIDQTIERYWQKFQTCDMVSPMMKLNGINRMDEYQKLDRPKDGFTQFVADNVDHNTDTLDGKGTFVK